MAEAMRGWVRKQCSRVLRRQRGGWRVKNFPGPPGLRNAFEMSRIQVKGSLNKEIMYAVIHNYITQFSINKQGGLCNPRTLEFRVIIMNENNVHVKTKNFQNPSLLSSAGA